MSAPRTIEIHTGDLDEIGELVGEGRWLVQASEVGIKVDEEIPLTLRLVTVFDGKAYAKTVAGRVLRYDRGVQAAEFDAEDIAIVVAG